MALSDEQISLMAFNDDPGDWNNLAFRDCWVNGYKTGARAVEAEVRKSDEALIRKLVEALEDFDDAGPPGEGWKSAPLLSLLASARARLEGKP